MNSGTFSLSLKSLITIKLIAFVFFFLVLTTSFLSANSEHSNRGDDRNEMTLGTERFETFEITSAFISSWKVKEIRDYAVLEVLQTSDFKLALEVTEELRKIVQEPILVHYGYENNRVLYTILVGRFDNVVDAVNYHETLR